MALTTKLGLDIPVVGGDSDAWGDKLNADLEIIDKAVQYERLVKSVAGASNVTLTAEESSYTVLRFTGVLTGNISVSIPVNPERAYVVENATSGAFTLTFKTTTGTGVVLPNDGVGRSVYNDGTNVAFTRTSLADSATSATNATNATNATSATRSTNLTGGNNTTLLGAIPYQSNTDTTTLLAPNTTTTKKVLTQTGTGTNGAAPVWDEVQIGAGILRAWVNFNGTRNVTDTGASTNGQPVLLNGSGNVTSVVKNATGDYTINFTSALPDGNYAVAFAGIAVNNFYTSVAVSGTAAVGPNLKTATQLRVVTANPNVNANLDLADISVTIFR